MTGKKDLLQGRILVVDHERNFYRSISSLADCQGYRITHVPRINEGLLKLSSDRFDIVLLREYMPDGYAGEIVARLAESPGKPVIVVVGPGKDPLSAEKLLKNGVWDYIIESESEADLLGSFKNILEYRRTAGENVKTEDVAAFDHFRSEGIVGNSPAIQECIDLVVKAGPSDANVLITGESGTGKELFAQATHAISSRSEKEMVVVDCASLPENLVESILFGHVRGAFTGADRASEGLIRQAHLSTLFLDEIGELPLDVQKKLLRVLQERTLRPVGGSSTIRVDFRVIAATNKDLHQLVAEKRFREDLLFRLKTFQIDLPNLRSRRGDLAELAYFFMNKYCAAKRLKTKRFSAEYLVVLRRYGWPGNVRELFNVIERAIAAASDSEILLPMHLPINIRVQAIDNLCKRASNQDEWGKGNRDEGRQIFPTLQKARENTLTGLEKEYLDDLLNSCSGNVSRACEIADISRSRLYALLKKYNLSPTTVAKGK